MNIFNIEIMKGINYEYKEKNIIIYLANQPYVRIKVNELKKYSNLKIEKNKMEYKFVPNIKEKKNTNLVYIKKIIKPYQYKGKNLNESDSKKKKTLVKFNKVNDNFHEGKKAIINNAIDSDAKKINYISNINARFKNLVKTVNPLKKSDTKTKEINGDGNCYYRCVSYFLLGTENYYKEIKKEIIDWIEGNKAKFIEFFGDDDGNNIKKEELAEDELNYIKAKNSWGGFHTIKIANIIFNISSAIYIDNGDENYKKYFYCENLNEDAELMILLYKNNNHFDLLYDSNNLIQNQILYESYDKINIKKDINKNKIKSEGTKFESKYVLCKFKSSEMLYDEIANYLKSIQKYDTQIKKEINIHPKWHYNQILSLFNIKYPERMVGQNEAKGKQRKNFRKEAEKFKLDENNRLCVLNPLNNKNQDNIYFKIPL